MQEIFDEGNKQYSLGNYTEAVRCFKLVIEAFPDNTIVSHNLALSYYRLGDSENALKYFELPAKAKSVEALISRGVIYRDIGRYDDSINDFAEALAEDPNSVGALSNYANSLREYNLPLLSIPFLKRAQKIEPDFVNAHLNESISYLTAGDLLKGWEKYEYRWFYEKGHNIKPYINRPEWQGEDLTNKTILVYAEQGLGDSIQFCRYLPLVKDLAAKVYFASKPPLTEFLQANYPDIHIFPNTADLPEFDYHCALLKLPTIFQTTIDTIPMRHPYLKAIGKDKLFWKKKLEKITKPKVGLIWRSNGEAWTSRIRNVPLETMLKVVSDKFQFINLQYQPTEEEIKLLKKFKVKVFDDKLLTGFASTSGLVSNLDAIVTNDTFTAHLGPAMGVKTHVMLAKYGVDWRWFLDRDDSPFYDDSIQLYRQPKFNDWDSVILRINQNLGI